MLSSLDFERVSASLLAVLPRFAPNEQQVAVTLYRLLAEGAPVPHPRLAAAVGTSEGDVDALLGSITLRPFVHHDDARRVIGFGGLAVVPMHHRFVVDGRTLYTWCAWDALFIPEMIGRTARVLTVDPQTGTPVRLEVSPTGITSASHPDAVASLLLPDGFRGEALKTISSFCHYVFLFETPASGAGWIARQPGTFLVSLEQAFELGKRKNAAQYGDALSALCTASQPAQ